MAVVKKQPGLRVSSRPATFRRAGLVFTREAQDVPLSELTKEQIKAIREEPLLAVADIEIEPTPETKEEGAK
jgi:hypothetical protein